MPVDWVVVVQFIFLAILLVLLIVLDRRVAGRDPRAVEARLDAVEERVERAIREESRREEERAGQLRLEVGAGLTSAADSIRASVAELFGVQAKQLDHFSGQLVQLTSLNEQKIEAMRDTVERRLTALQEDNARKLEEMRHTVDERLQATLDHRLGESFRLVSERLEQVHKGLGEMQALASGVGDLKRVLTNVRARGIWGEVQLQTLLEQVLAPDQYAANVATREGSGERVEFAVKLPGRDIAEGAIVWLPIDAKFPLEDYRRLVEASERGDAEAVDAEVKRLDTALKVCARDIRDKYINPPRTTDFALLFLPTEGLYAEVLRRPQLVDLLQREFRVVPAGPTTLWGILNSLQMGFRTLAIQQRASEVWSLLGVVKTEFGRFGDVLDAVQRKLQEASAKIDRARQTGRRLAQRLQDVQDVPVPDAGPLFGLTNGDAGEDQEEEALDQP